MKFLVPLAGIFVLAFSAVGQDAKTTLPDSKSEIPNLKSQVSTFKSDNCTFFPDGDYADCCVAHDEEYFVGGGLKDRLAADKRLRKCVMSKGKGWQRKLLANVMFLGVRVGGVQFLPTPFRWGFGNKWPRMRPTKSITQTTH